MRTNLQPVYTTSQCSGADVLHIFDSFEKAEDVRGYDKILWGNLATQRPSK